MSEYILFCIYSAQLREKDPHGFSLLSCALVRQHSARVPSPMTLRDDHKHVQRNHMVGRVFVLVDGCTVSYESMSRASALPGTLFSLLSANTLIVVQPLLYVLREEKVRICCIPCILLQCPS
jgi:hypothetical protein